MLLPQAVHDFRGKLGAGRWRQAVILTTLALVAALLAYRVLHTASQAPNAAIPTRSLGMTVSGTGQELNLSWNPEAPEVQSATKAHLIIRDGDQLTVRTLSPRDLSTGSSRYTPAGSSVIFELKLLRPDQPAMVETLRYFHSNESSSPVAELPAAGTPDSPPNPARARRLSPHYETAFGDRRPENRDSGTVIVHGVVARDTPIDVRVSRESLLYGPQQEDRGKVGFLHHVKSWGKKPAMLWPFHRNPGHK